MKITEVIVHPLTAKLPKKTWTAHEPTDTQNLILFEVRTDEGITGFSEVQGGPQKTICDMAKVLGELAVGMDAMGHETVWEKLFSATSPRPGGLGGWDGLPAPLPRNARPQIMAAIGGIDIALWDIKGKATGLPVYKLLGGTRDQVFTYATGGYYVEGEPKNACADELAKFVADGFRAVKLKTGAYSIEDEVERVRATRAAIGDDVLFMLDLNAPYSVEECIQFANLVAEHNVFWLEEPLHWYLQPADYVRLAAASPIPLAHCEREWHRFTVRDFIDSGAIRYVQFDSTRHAGFTESLRIAHYAAQRGVQIAPHTARQIHSPLVSAFADRAFAAESHGSFDKHPIQHAAYIGGPFMRDGMVHIPDTPGFGVDIDWKAIEKFRA
jgi:D-galactarolactone cycloisomerase